ncbi:MAG TPA: hypothetical protein PLQ13_00310 [Candidatus Krumholzibacteria bacterium]|nr:hypothetical protein [Candidatus Krumholzibacteria bacterium]
MAVLKEDHVLVRDESFVKYERLLSKAEVEGRIDGPNKCLVCGMRYLSKQDADECCRIVP